MLGNSQGNFKFQVQDLIDWHFRLVQVTVIKTEWKWCEDGQIMGLSKIKTVCSELALSSWFLADSTAAQWENVLYLKDACLLAMIFHNWWTRHPSLKCLKR